MTPAARVAAAIEILDRIGDGMAAEQALTGWARGARYAGSKDRAAVRDHVFGVLRRKHSCAVAGGAGDGRGLMLGALRLDEHDPHVFFTGQGHAPAPLSDAEAHLPAMPVGPVALDLPDWSHDPLRRALGDSFEEVAGLMRHRAALFLRVNLRKSSVAAAQDMLLADGIETEPHSLSSTALRVIEGTRRVRQSEAYREGFVEIQDAASQAAADLVPLHEGAQVLDYCAGGGGKSLALAARADIRSFAHDANPRRMVDLGPRAARAGARITALKTEDLARHGPFDVVIADVPCSGSGTWRRQPDAKWRFTPDDLAQLTQVQDEILDQCAGLTAADGHLVYITCALFAEENEDRVQAFLARCPEWSTIRQRRISPIEGADGLFSTVFFPLRLHCAPIRSTLLVV